MNKRYFLGIMGCLALGLPGCVEVVSKKTPPPATISIPDGATPLPTEAPPPIPEGGTTMGKPWIAPKCGKKNPKDGFKSGFTWKPKSDGAWKGAVAVVPWWAGEECKVRSGKKTYGMRYKGDIGDIDPRPVHILDGIEGDKLKRNTEVKCGCYFWIIPEPNKRTD